MNTIKNNIESDTISHLKWGAVTLPKEGHRICGDRYLVKEHRDKILVGAIDGLGHGKEAAEASQKAIEVLQNFSSDSLITIVNRCHKDLKQTRGVVMSLALFDIWDRSMSWISIGNIDGVLLRHDKDATKKKRNLVLRGGVVGYKLPMLQASIYEIAPGDTLIFTTDGVESDYIDNINSQSTPKETVEYVASNYFKPSDDSLVLVAQYLGS